MEYKKQNSDENPVGVDAKLKQLKERDHGKIPFRIDDKTVVMLQPERCSEEYRQNYLNKLKKL